MEARNPPSKNVGDEPTRTFDELMLQYLKETPPIKRAAELDLAIARVLTAFFTGTVMNTLGAQPIRAYVQQQRGQMIMDSAIRSKLSLLSAAITYALHKWEWDIPNLIEGRKPCKGDDRIRWLTSQMAVRDLLRHTTVQVTKKYAHLAPENVRKAVGMLDGSSRFSHVGAPKLQLIMGNKLLGR